jgi:ABC-2 type transport system ATP-binding protein
MAATFPLSGVLTVPQPGGVGGRGGRGPAAWGVRAAPPLWWTLTVPLPNPPVPPANTPAPRPARTPLLTVSRVSRRYGDRVALQPLDLTLAAGQCVAVLGANGSGKSTLLRIAAGRDTPSSGQVSYGGRVMSEDDPVVRTEIAVVGDMVSAYPDLTVREHLQLVSVAHGEGHLAADLVDRALAECRLADHARALPGSLSSGQLQALQLATVLVRPLRLMVLDEPEQRLDPAARRWLGGLLRGEKEAGAAVLLATHHTELAAAVADYVIVLSDGAITAEGPPDVTLAGWR